MRFIVNFLIGAAIYAAVFIVAGISAALFFPDSSLAAFIALIALPVAVVWTNRHFNCLVYGASNKSMDAARSGAEEQSQTKALYRPSSKMHVAKRPVAKETAQPVQVDERASENEAKPTHAWAINPDIELSIAAPAVPTSSSKLKKGRGAWVPHGQNATVKGRDIGGLLYVGTPPRIKGTYIDQVARAFIDPSVQVSVSGNDPQGEGMGYYPSYAAISPRSRATYLEWLADGRCDQTVNAGYMFLYFYGLERRFFVDQPDPVERRQIIDEVRRLRVLFDGSWSAKSYLGEFVEAAEVFLSSDDITSPAPSLDAWAVPLRVKVQIGRLLAAGRTIDGQTLLCWFLASEYGRVRTPARRCFEEFCALFILIFGREYPDGFAQKAPKKLLTYRYEAASREFTKNIKIEYNGLPIPDISDLRRPITAAQKIADEAMVALDKYSRFLGKNPSSKASAEAHALLPSELWELFPNSAIEKVRTWVSQQIENGGLVPVLSLAEKMLGNVPEKLTKRALIDMADALARLGFGMAPDPRFALRMVKTEEPIVLFELGSAVKALSEVTDAYRLALVEMTLATFIAHADGRLVAAEKDFLKAQAASRVGLSLQEQRRLLANINWMLSVPPDMALIKKAAKASSPEAKDVIRAMVVDTAKSDGHIHAKEVEKIEAIYKLLDLDAGQVYTDLHGGVEAPRVVRSAVPAAEGEAIPPEQPEKTPAQVLDMAKISAIRADTKAVSAVLSEIFSQETAEQEVSETEPSKLPGLAEPYLPLVIALLEEAFWEEDAFDDLCATHKAIPAAAIEDINEWAFETYDDALLDAYGQVDLIPETADAIRAELEI